jgi:hypothetical protein
MNTDTTKNTLQFDINYFEDILQTEWDKNPAITSLYKIIDIESVDTDLGKGIEDKEAIIQELSSGRFFVFEYASDEGRHSLNARGLANPNPIIGTEVFPHTVTKIVYKKVPQK